MTLNLKKQSRNQTRNTIIVEMTSLLNGVKSIISFSKKRKRMDEQDRHDDLIRSMQIGALIAYEYKHSKQIHGSNKKNELPRVRKNFETDICLPLGDIYFRRSYRMKRQSFYMLYYILEDELKKEFVPNIYNNRRHKSNYHICLKIRLSAAIRFYAGGDPYDIMLSHGISHSSVYTSLWGVTDCINRCKKLQFQFPNHQKQQVISEGFKAMSGALFDCVVGAIDGMLVWITKPTKNECKDEKCGEKNSNAAEKISLDSTYKPSVITN